jgi:hypothetical protein
MAKKYQKMGIMPVEMPDSPNDIHMDSPQIPVIPSAADLERGYVLCEKYPEMSKNPYSNYSEAMDEAREVDGFVKRSNFDERL